MRVDHWIKHVFIVPGLILSYILGAPKLSNEIIILNALIGFSSAFLIASANYVINEFLDSNSDIYHPEKSKRPGAKGLLNFKFILIQYFLLSLLGIFLSTKINVVFFIFTLLFFLSGLIYNLKPIRSKDVIFLDVISESANNPIRLSLGWAMVSISTPPLSILLTYWAIGAFLMSAKRLSELKQIISRKGKTAAHLYRKSFQQYTNENLTISCFVYSLISIIGLTIFTIKYKSEFIISLPIFIAIFSYYMRLAMNADSIVQKTENLFKDKKIVFLLILLSITFATSLFADLPWLNEALKKSFIVINK